MSCTAINLHDKTPCKAPKHESSPLFCDTHRKQCQSLYAHYKKRQATLAELEQSDAVPAAVAALPKDLERYDWMKLDSYDTLESIHSYFFKKLILLRRCILARDIHHSHFYRDNSDFGHQAYLDRLRSQRTTLEKCLERIGKRLFEIRYENAKWMEFIKQLEQEDEVKQEAEKKKVKAEAKLYKEYLHRVEEIKAVEQERIREEVEREEVWDPIEEVVRNQRVGYVALVRALLEKRPEGMEEEKNAIERAKEVDKKGTMAEDMKMKGLINYTKRFGLDAGKRRRMDFRPVTRVLDENGHYEEGSVGLFASNDELYEGTLDAINDLFNLERGAAGYLLEEREATLEKMEQESRDIKELVLLRLVAQKPHLLRVALQKGSVDEFLKDEEVKNTDLRDLALALANPTLKQIRNACADYWVTREEFEEDVESTFGSEDEDDDTASVNTEDSNYMPDLQDVWDDTPEVPRPKKEPPTKEPKSLPANWQTDEEIERLAEEALASFGITAGSSESPSNQDPNIPDTVDLDDADAGGDADSAFGGSDGGDSAISGASEDSGYAEQGNGHTITVCGSRIYNYTTQLKVPLPRKGWFQFVLMTGCTPDEARSLCMTFKELKELELLLATNYFHGLPGLWSEPDSDGSGVGAFRRTGIVPFYWNNSLAPEILGSRAATKKMLESRGIFCAYLDRNEQSARRFIKWAESFRSEMAIYAIDGVSDAVITQPPKEECWILRSKPTATNRAGRRATGRGKKDSGPDIEDGWEIHQRVDAEFIKYLHKSRRWVPQCNDYIEVIIWDQHSTKERPYEFFFNRLYAVTNKAFKHKDALGQFDYCLKMYKKYLYTDDTDSKRMQMIKRAQRRLRRLRRNRTEAQLKGANPKDYYNEADFEVDRYFGSYDTSLYWEHEDPYSEAIGLENIYEQFCERLEMPDLDFDTRVRLTFQYVEDVNHNNRRKHVYKGDLGEAGERPADSIDHTDEEIAALLTDFDTATTEQLETLKEEMEAAVYSKTDLRDYWAEVDGECETMEIMAKSIAKMAGEDAKKRNPSRYGRLPPTSTAEYALAFCTFMINLVAGDPEGILSSSSGDPEDSFAGGKITAKDFPAVLDVAFKAKHPPKHLRPREMSKEAFDEWDKFEEAYEKDSNVLLDGLCQKNGPLSAILATIASLWKQGLAEPVPTSYGLGAFPAIAGRYIYDPEIAPEDKEKKRESGLKALRRFLDPRLQAPKRHTDYKMYIDYRDSPFNDQPVKLLGPIEMLLPDPDPNPFYIRDAYRKLSAQNPDMYFSLLRLRVKNENLLPVQHWDQESYDKPPKPSTPEELIQDPYGRYWRLHFEARESNWNWRKWHATVHHLLVQRGGYGDQVRVRGDMILIWAKGKAAAMKRTVEVTCTVLKPKMGVMPDWGKSWVVRTKKEMDELDEWWWEQ
ncbi:hypothetical protein BJ508DRAFT_415001 [Ascobolus immersus RN42]|uniref:Uncharacterized protein n=1 Tax=Ascobolus immersus RN42 TaxID=1160509 RepID=A0A3N4I4Z8_ASCIM|nr:hypothetical protein BJ508DRAFT_415001 [Ascobolus immersus RN42]